MASASASRSTQRSSCTFTFSSRCHRASMKVSVFALWASYFFMMLPPTAVFIWKAWRFSRPLRASCSLECSARPRPWTASKPAEVA